VAVKTLADLLAEGVEGRGVLVRCDLNVPLDDSGNVTETGRSDASPLSRRSSTAVPR
jgi:phosphoglycerate kinase